MAEEERNLGGRPEFKPTKRQREEVALMIGDAVPEEQIAAAIGISRPTLVKHFGEEIMTGRARRRLAYLKMLENQAKKGNSSSTRLLLQRLEMNPDRSLMRVPKEQKLGKKEADRAAAVEPSGTDWDELMSPDAANDPPTTIQ